MKRIGILSDTHSCWDDRYAAHFKNCDEIWHAGDVGDIGIIRRLEEVVPVVRAVRGNIDHGDVVNIGQASFRSFIWQRSSFCS